jgi:hypothetical protein
MVAKGWEREQRVEPDPYRWFRGVEDNEPIDLAAGPRQPEVGTGSRSTSRQLVCRQTYLQDPNWRNNLGAYQECLNR